MEYNKIVFKNIGKLLIIAKTIFINQLICLDDFSTAYEKEKTAEDYSDSDAFNSNLAEKKLKKLNPILYGGDEVKALIPQPFKKKKTNAYQRMHFCFIFNNLVAKLFILQINLKFKSVPIVKWIQ